MDLGDFVFGGGSRLNDDLALAEDWLKLHELELNTIAFSWASSGSCSHLINALLLAVAALVHCVSCDWLKINFSNGRC